MKNSWREVLGSRVFQKGEEVFVINIGYGKVVREITPEQYKRNYRKRYEVTPDLSYDSPSTKYYLTYVYEEGYVPAMDVELKK